MWILRCRDTVLSALGVESGERIKAGRWVGLGLWVIITALACIGGWVGEKIEMIGIIATLGIAWFLPCESLHSSPLHFVPLFSIPLLAAGYSTLMSFAPQRFSSSSPSTSAHPSPSSSQTTKNRLPLHSNPNLRLRPLPRPGVHRSHSRANSLNDPMTDILLARKERQLQKRRVGRRLWQDLLVYIGILPGRDPYFSLVSWALF